MARAVPVLSWSDDSRMPAKAHPRSAALSKTALEPRFRVGQGRSFTCKQRIRWTACCPYENIPRHGCCGLGFGCTGAVVGRAERLAAEREQPAERSDDPLWERRLVHIQHCSDHRRGDLAAGHHDTDPTFDIRRRAESAPTGSRMPSRPPRRVGPKLIVTRKPFPTRSHTKAPTHD